MGIATDFDDYMETRPQTPAETREQQAATETRGDVEATSDGQVVTRATPFDEPRVVVKGDPIPWD